MSSKGGMREEVLESEIACGISVCWTGSSVKDSARKEDGTNPGEQKQKEGLAFGLGWRFPSRRCDESRGLKIEPSEKPPHSGGRGITASFTPLQVVLLPVLS